MCIHSAQKIKVLNRPWGAHVDKNEEEELVSISGDKAAHLLHISYQVVDKELEEADSGLSRVLFAKNSPFHASEGEYRCFLPLK